MTTYTIAYREVLFACVPDGDDEALDREIADVAEQGRVEVTRDDLTIERGLVLTNDAPDDESRIAWQNHDFGWLTDADGTPFEYAVRPDTEGTVTNEAGTKISFDTAVLLMDDNLREELHGLYDTDQEFFLAYCLRHREKFGEEFEANKRNPVW